VSILPAISELRSASAEQKTAPGWRAVFVGSDALPQNRLTIAYLPGSLEIARIGVPLFIYGRQRMSWPSVPNVTFCGYVEDISEAYIPRQHSCVPYLPTWRYQDQGAGGVRTRRANGRQRRHLRGNAAW